MKMSIVNMVTMGITVLALSGCAGSGETLRKASGQPRQEVFQVVQTTERSAGKAVVHLEFPVKTFRARFFNAYLKHSDPPYTAILTIDGQSVELTDEPVLESLPGDFRNNPEVGTGWRYVFRKTLQLEPGRHHIAIAVPRAEVVAEREVVLASEDYHLKLTPIYAASVTRHVNVPRFSQGLRGVAIENHTRSRCRDGADS